MHRLTIPLSLLGFVGGAGAVLLCFHAIPVRSVVAGAQVGLLYERLSLHLWFLEMILVIAALVLAILGIVGYQEVKRVAVETAKEETRRYHEGRDRGLGGLRTGEPSVGEVADSQEEIPREDSE